MSFDQVASFTQSDDVAQDAERGEAHEGEDEDQETAPISHFDRLTYDSHCQHSQRQGNKAHPAGNQIRMVRKSLKYLFLF